MNTNLARDSYVNACSREPFDFPSSISDIEDFSLNCSKGFIQTVDTQLYERLSKFKDMKRQSIVNPISVRKSDTILYGILLSCSDRKHAITADGLNNEDLRSIASVCSESEESICSEMKGLRHWFNSQCLYFTVDALNHEIYIYMYNVHCVVWSNLYKYLEISFFRRSTMIMLYVFIMMMTITYFHILVSAKWEETIILCFAM